MNDRCFTVLVVQNRAPENLKLAGNGPKMAAMCSLQDYQKNHIFVVFKILEDTARYAGLLLAPAEGFGLRPRLFLPFGQKKSFLCCFGQF